MWLRDKTVIQVPARIMFLRRSESILKTIGFSSGSLMADRAFGNSLFGLANLLLLFDGEQNIIRVTVLAVETVAAGTE